MKAKEAIGKVFSDAIADAEYARHLATGDYRDIFHGYVNILNRLREGVESAIDDAYDEGYIKGKEDADDPQSWWCAV